MFSYYTFYLLQRDESQHPKVLLDIRIRRLQQKLAL